jgi:mono/diheme cytochrome c family protein
MIRDATLLLGGIVLAGLAAIGWQNESSDGLSRQVSSVPAGVDLFQAKGCASCHRGADTRSSIEVGPSLLDASTWASTRIPGVSARAYLDRSIRDPAAFRSPLAGYDAVMPGLVLNDAEIDALVDYLLQG